MNDFHEKLKFLFKKNHISPKEIAIKLGISGTMVSYYLNGQREFGGNVAMKWGQAFGIDPLWLMSKGEQGIDPLAAQEPTTIAQTQEDVINIPILSPDAAGGFRPNEQADIEQYTIGMMPFNRTIAHTGDVVIPVYGDSMTPKYPAGSYILIRPIEAWREYIELGRSYVLELADWRRLIKIVRKGHDATHYLLDSYNVDYESNEISKSFINSVWLVVASVNREEL